MLNVRHFSQMSFCPTARVQRHVISLQFEFFYSTASANGGSAGHRVCHELAQFGIQSFILPMGQQDLR